MYQSSGFLVDKNWKKLILSLDIDLFKLLENSGISLDIFDKSNISITAKEYFSLWVNLADMIKSDIPAPIIIAKNIDMETFSPVLMAAIYSKDFITCTGRIKEFKPLVGPLKLELVETDDLFIINILSAIEDIELHPLVVASELAFFTRLIRDLTKKDIIPAAIETRIELKSDKYRDYFGIKPVKGLKDSISFKKRDAIIPFSTVKESVWNFFEPEFRKKMEFVESDHSFSAAVRALLMELLPMGITTIDQVAKRLAISTRSLQRKLKIEGTTYQKQLNHSRELIARHYLKHSDMTSGEISFLIGYDDPGSFSRAFHLWTGKTPESIRRVI